MLGFSWSVAVLCNNNNNTEKTTYECRVLTAGMERRKLVPVVRAGDCVADAMEHCSWPTQRLHPVDRVKEVVLAIRSCRMCCRNNVGDKRRNVKMKNLVLDHIDVYIPSATHSPVGTVCCVLPLWYFLKSTDV